MKEQRPLTDKQEKFCQEYMIDLNATQAAIRAGYVANCINSFGSIGTENLHKLAIKDRICQLKAKTAKITGISVKYVVNSLKSVAERCMASETYDAAGANKALQLLGMHVDAFSADNASKQAPERTFTLVEVRTMILDSDKREAEILDISVGMAD